MTSPTVWLFFDAEEQWPDQPVLFQDLTDPNYPGCQAVKIPAQLYYQFIKAQSQAFIAYTKLAQYYHVENRHESTRTPSPRGA